MRNNFSEAFGRGVVCAVEGTVAEARRECGTPKEKEPPPLEDSEPLPSNDYRTRDCRYTACVTVICNWCTNEPKDSVHGDKRDT